MSHVIAYSHITEGTIASDIWDEAWFALSSWHSYLQSFPGLKAVHLAARALENGDIRLHTMTTWEYPEQLEEWRESRWSAESLLSNLDEPAYDVVEETYEVLC